MKAIFSLLAFLIALLPMCCQAQGMNENDYAVLNDMYAHPGNYIRYGGASIGFSFLVNKNSIDVQQYNPPNYIIAAREVIHHYDSFAEWHDGIGESVHSRIIRYKYDYANRKMYVEQKDRNNNPYWEYVDPQKIKSYHDENPIAGGELLFYLAYGINFYDKPVVRCIDDYINKGISSLALAKLPNGGDNSICHMYNHRTNQIEWWKLKRNDATGKDEFMRVK